NLQAKIADDRLHAVMSGRASTIAYAQASKRQIELIVDDENAFGRNAKPGRDQPRRHAAFIHVRLRLDQKKIAPAGLRLARAILGFPIAWTDAQAPTDF